MVETVPFEQPLRGVLHLPETLPAPTVLVAHGFKAFMGWGMFPWIADTLAQAGFAAVRVDFSFNGADEQGDFTRLDLFERNSYTQEQVDLDALLTAVVEGAEPFGGVCRPERIGLLGHSRGGGGVLLKAAGEARVAAVATLGAVASADRFPPEARETAEREGRYHIPNARTGQLMPVGFDAFLDAETHDILGATRAMTQPLLVVHGSADETVGVEDGQLLAAAGGELLEIEGAGHTFGAVHPFEGPTPHLSEAVAAVSRFFRTQLA